LVSPTMKSRSPLFQTSVR